MSGLPAWIGAALDSKLEHVSRAGLRERARAASEAYRAGGTSEIISSELDALAYAVVRMPATYAAVRAALARTAEIVPDFQPRSVLDVGAGPGTASWAAAVTWPSLAQTTLIDRNAHLLALGRQLAASAGAPPMDVSALPAELSDALPDRLQADVVMASYALAEIAPPALRDILVKLWSLADRLLVIVEPGTMDGFRRILSYREILLAHGARIVAPCSHEGACPLAGNARWCHFNVRLPRSRDHLIAKDASVPYEDEKFIYLAAAKGFAEVARGRRILATPKVNKASVALTLCAPAVVTEYVIERRDKDAYKAAKRCDWGDALVL
jgi:ribosomal protein RSM22 (predicted rRNA methylase)